MKLLSRPISSMRNPIYNRTFLFVVLIICGFSGCGPNLETKTYQPSRPNPETKTCQPQRKYLVIRPYAGLANRLRMLASAKIIAALSDRNLIVDWLVTPNELPGKWQDFFLNPITDFDHSTLYDEGCTLEMIRNVPQACPIDLLEKNPERCTMEMIRDSLTSDQMIVNLGQQNNQKGLDSQQILGNIPTLTQPIVYFETSLSFSPDISFMSYNEYRARYRIFYQDLDPHLWITNSVKEFQKTHTFDQNFMVGVHYRSWATGILMKAKA